MWAQAAHSEMWDRRTKKRCSFDESAMMGTSVLVGLVAALVLRASGSKQHLPLNEDLQNNSLPAGFWKRRGKKTPAVWSRDGPDL